MTNDEPPPREPRPPTNGTPPAPLQPRRTRPSQVVRGERHGAPYVRVGRTRDQVLRVIDPRHWVAMPAADRPESGAGRIVRRVRNTLFGSPLTSDVEAGERLGKSRALAVFASDALSSTAYATEEILLVLMLAGAAALHLSLPIAIAITLLLVTVVISYRQTVRAYPHGGGSYTVASDNIGPGAGLIAAAALLSDYVLTVAVSISAGSLAVISAFPAIAEYRLEIALASLLLIAIVNLRGVRESGAIFAVPTYIFIGAFALLISVGLARLVVGIDGATLTTARHPAIDLPAAHTLTIFLVLRAFSSGCTALTGVEAIANGVTAFKAPEWRNASITMAWMGGILAVFFVGATFLSARLGVVPMENDSVISQTGRLVFGGAMPLYYLLQAGTAMVLILAANTAFNDFPRLSSILAGDGYMPRQFSSRGDRLTFSVGIVVLSVIAALVLIAFHAETDRLIPLYAVGVFVAFTLSQAGMLVHWRRVREAGWRTASVINGTGAAATGVVAVIVASSKFTQGAWVVMLLIPLLVTLLHSIHAHYRRVEELLALPTDGVPLRPRATDLPAEPIVVPVRSLNLVAVRAVEYARHLSSAVTAVHIVRTTEDTAAFEARWAAIFPDVPLATIESPYRTFLGPLRAYIDGLPLQPRQIITVVVPEFEPAHWWQRFLHNRTGDRITVAFSGHPEVMVTRATIAAASVTRGARA